MATLGIEEVLAIQALAPDKKLQYIESFDIIVQYKTKQSNLLVKDIVKNCQFMSNKRDVKTGDKGVSVELKLITSHIQWSK